MVQRILGLALDQGAAHGIQPLERPAGLRVERHMQRHGQRGRLRQRTRGIIQQQLFGGRMAAHVSCFSNVSRKLRSARRMRDFTVPKGSLSSSAMAIWVLSSKNAF